MKKENLTKEYILQAYKNLLEKNHYDSITVCDICEKAGVSRMSFYRNFESKEDLTLKSFEMISQEIKSRLDKVENLNHYLVIKEFFEVFKSFDKIINSFNKSEFSNNFSTLITQKLKNATPNDIINKTSKYIPIFFLSAISTVLIEWLRNGTKETPDEMARLLCSLINIENFDSHKNEDNII